MHKASRSIAINTDPLIALVAAIGNLDILRKLYKNVHVTYEVAQEIYAGGLDGFAVDEFDKATWLNQTVIDFALRQAGEKPK